MSFISITGGSVYFISLLIVQVILMGATIDYAIAAKICETISQGVFASSILILAILSGVLAACDKIICKK